MTTQQLPGGGGAGGSQVKAPLNIRTGAPLNLLIFLVCALTIAGIWSAVLQRTGFERDQAVAAAMKSNANLAIAFEQQVYRTLKAAEQVAAFVREQYLQKDAGIDLHAWVEQGVIRDSMFTIVSVVDEHGVIIRSTGQATGSVNYADRAFFQEQRASVADELFVSRPVLGRVSRRWQIPMSLRITRPDGSFAGVVVMSVDPASFTDFYTQADLGRLGLLELSGLDGVVRGRTIGSQNSFGVDAERLSWYRRRAEAPDGHFIDDGAGADGVSRIVSYRTMAGYPLMVTVGTAFDDELAPVMQRRTNYFMVVGVATLALMLFAAVLISVLRRQRAAADALQASEAVFRATFHQAAMGIAHIKPDGRILGANDKFCRMLGYTVEELRARSVFDLSDADAQEEARRFLASRLSPQAPDASPEIEKTYCRKDGTALWVCEALSAVGGQHGGPEFLVVVSQDITARKALEARLSHDALHDALTGLPNRVMFRDRLARVIESARRRGDLAAVLYIDLDGFKEVNDTHGHAAGDALLQQVARRLEACVRAEDTVSRFGGDEFGIVLAALGNELDCEVVGQKVVTALAQPFEVDGLVLHVSASVGAAVFPLQGDEATMLMARADAAMYAAKNAGKNRFYRQISADAR